MPKLPVKYFKTVTEYAKYNWSGAIDKLYPVVKTVTKNFTRTDPVYVRIGEDGEPEIHYTMTQADGKKYFASMDLGNATLYVRNGAVLTSCEGLFTHCYCKRIFLDSIGSSSHIESLFGLYGDWGKTSPLKEIGLFDTSGVTGSAYGFAQVQNSLTEIPAFDLSNVTDLLDFVLDCERIEQFHCVGMKVSFKLSYTSIGHDAILEVFNNLGEVDATAGITLTLGSDKLALMSDEEKAIATGKGWVLA